MQNLGTKITILLPNKYKIQQEIQVFKGIQRSPQEIHQSCQPQISQINSQMISSRRTQQQQQQQCEIFYLSLRLRRAPRQKATESNQESLCTATKESQSFRFMPSLAKLIPSAGSGSSGGTSSAGKVTSQDSPGCPYKHKFSLSRTTNQNKKQYNKYI